MAMSPLTAEGAGISGIGSMGAGEAVALRAFALFCLLSRTSLRKFISSAILSADGSSDKGTGREGELGRVEVALKASTTSTSLIVNADLFEFMFSSTSSSHANGENLVGCDRSMDSS